VRLRVAGVVQNGLVLYTGTVMTDDGKEKKVNIDFEPFKPINTSLYLCDNKFHTEVRDGPHRTPVPPALSLFHPAAQ
jgi:peptide subunit release factor 1 (eRF1)